MSSGIGVVAYLGAWLTTIGGVWFLFEKADDTLAPDVRARLGEWLSGLSPGNRGEQGPFRFFSMLFDRAFGERHLSLKCFRRSVLASFLLAWVVAACWVATHPPDTARMVLQAFIMVTLAGIVFTIVPDYLSLLETRYVLRRLESGGSAVGWLALDFFATGLLAASAFIVTTGFTQGFTAVPSAVRQLALFEITMVVTDNLTEAGQPDGVVYAMPMAPFFYATFFTSAWLWLFVAASGVLQLAARLLRPLAGLKNLLDVRDKPGRALGLAAVLLVTVAFMAAAPVLALMQATA